MELMKHGSTQKRKKRQIDLQTHQPISSKIKQTNKKAIHSLQVNLCALRVSRTAAGGIQKKYLN